MVDSTREKGELSPLIDKLREGCLEKTSGSLSPMTEHQIKEIINTTHGIRYPFGHTTKSIFELLKDARWLESCGEDSYVLKAEFRNNSDQLISYN